MEHQQIIDIINAVSSSNLSSFEFEQGDTYISMNVADRHSESGKIEYVAASHTETSPKTEVSNGTEIKSPLVGTFYAAASPEEDPFVKVGDRVSKGQTLGIIEAMKLMNEIESEYDGTITQILVNNKETVEYGQPLFIINKEES